MILAVDAGNSNIVAAIMDGRCVIAECRFATGKGVPFEYHYRKLSDFVKRNKKQIDGCVISSVAVQVNESLIKACKMISNNEPVFISCDIHTGMNIIYDDPHKLGADLIADGAGAISVYGCPVIVIDIGTATTFSAINDKKEYMGSVIAPGPYTAIYALANKASLLPERGFAPTDKIIGTNTIDCMSIGAFTAHAAMIDGMIDRIREYMKFDAKVVITGGPAKEIAKMCKREVICDTSLMHFGLQYLYELNKGEK